MTFFNTGAGKDGYFLRFETDDKEKYLYMQDAARRCIDGKVPPRHGKWIKERPHHGQQYYCSACGQCGVWTDDFGTLLTRYCPNCGAKMDEEVEQNG